MNLVLCGLPGAGKTTLGKELAEEMDWDFIDTDTLIAASGLSCRDFYLQKGKSAFRQLESSILAGMMGIDSTVVATGGGVIESPENIRYIKQIGPLCYLRAPIELLWERLSQRPLPAYLDPLNPQASFYDLAKRREALLEKIADTIVDVVTY